MKGRIGLVVLALLVAGAARPSTQRADAVPPLTRVITLPDFWGASAIWGASGSDRRGRIWLGITSNDEKTGSAHLFELDGETLDVTDRGDVVSKLERLSLRRPGELQMKIHSRIVEMPDGYLYFASMDESGENSNGSRLPTWGGHLWRTRGPGYLWEHLARTDEALIAVAAGGRYVYALGYFNHVLYQFDTKTKAVKSTAVGAAGGHVSRNFFADERGHVFVPRVTRAAKGTPAASLVEFDPQLVELAVTPLAEYFERGLDGSHGIVSVHQDGGGGWFFATGKGRLYQVEATGRGAARVVDRGWFHPAGPRYVAAMFRDAKSSSLHGVASSSSDGGNRFEWITRQGERATVAPLPYGDAPVFPAAALLYGSMTRDAKGRFYAVGTMKYKPLVLQITVPDGVSEP